jgi:nucleotide-binding universal stress UspA family protein
MCAFKSILVPVSDGVDSRPAFEAALRLGGQTAGHVIALHVRIDPASAVPLVGEGMSGAMVEEMMSAAERQAANRAEAARAMVEQTCARLEVPLLSTPDGQDKVSAEWVEVVGREEEEVALRGRLSDLVVLDRLAEDKETPSPMTLNAVLMESGRPLMVVPPQWGRSVGRRVAIAWNGSAEASRAVAAAMPLLVGAESVTILSVSEDGGTVGGCAANLTSYLAWHGIKPQLRKLSGSSTRAGETLMTECAAVEADLLVMGAYTHSRLRQLILGGVTQYMLRQTAIACLMCH